MGALRDHLDYELQSREGISLREALALGYHIDHIKPLHSFDTKEIGDEAFKECWAIDNLMAISAEKNLAKGGSYDDDTDAS